MCRAYTDSLFLVMGDKDWGCLRLTGAFMLLILFVGCVSQSAITSGIKPDQPSVAVSGELQKMFKEALELIKNENYKEAIPAFKHITEKEPGVAGPFVNLGIAYTELEQYSEAEQALLQALKINAQHIAANNRLGLLYRRMGKFSEARLAYERVLKVDSEYALAHLNLGILCDIYLQDLECAMTHFEKYQLLKPEDDTQVSAWLADLKQRAPANANSENQGVH